MLPYGWVSWGSRFSPLADCGCTAALARSGHSIDCPRLAGDANSKFKPRPSIAHLARLKRAIWCQRRKQRNPSDLAVKDALAERSRGYSVFATLTLAWLFLATNSDGYVGYCDANAARQPNEVMRVLSEHSRQLGLIWSPALSFICVVALAQLQSKSNAWVFVRLLFISLCASSACRSWSTLLSQH